MLSSDIKKLLEREVTANRLAPMLNQTDFDKLERLARAYLFTKLAETLEEKPQIRIRKIKKVK